MNPYLITYIAIGLILFPVFVLFRTNLLREGLFGEDILWGIFLGIFWPASAIVMGFMIVGLAMDAVWDIAIIPPKD